MKDLSVKQNVLQEIIDLMDAREGEGLKKHPKFAKAAPEAKPEDENSMPAEEAAPIEEKPSGEGELSEDDLQMLLEKFKELQ